MDDVLRQFCRLGLAAEFREYALLCRFLSFVVLSRRYRVLSERLGHGICGNARHGLGMAHRHGLHPMRRHEHGGALLVHADQWRSLLRIRRPGSSGMGSSGVLADGMVQLARPSQWRPFNRLCAGRHGVVRRGDEQPGLHSTALASLPYDGAYHAQSWVYQ